MLPIWGPIIAGAAALAGTIGQAISNRKAEKRQNQANRQLAQFQYNKDLEMWNKANTYNAPEAQMSRLKEANLNPNLVYGGGNVTGNATAQLPKYQAPQQEYNALPISQIAMQTLGAYQDISVKQAQTDNIKTQTRLAELNEMQKQAQSPWWGYQAEKSAEFSRYKTENEFNRWLMTAAQRESIYDKDSSGNYVLRNRGLMQSSADAQYRKNVAELQKTNSDISLIKARMEYQQLQNKYMSWGSPFWQTAINALGLIPKFR